MAKAGLTTEQQDHLEQHIAAIGHNQGPALLEHAEKIIEHAGQHPRLKAEVTGIRVMVDMMRSEVAGEYKLPATTVGYISAGLLLVGAMTGVGFVTAQPIATLLLDAPVVATIIATLHGEIEGYVAWRVARDPSYIAVKQELFGSREIH